MDLYTVIEVVIASVTNPDGVKPTPASFLGRRLLDLLCAGLFGGQSDGFRLELHRQRQKIRDNRVALVGHRASQPAALLRFLAEVLRGFRLHGPSPALSAARQPGTLMIRSLPRLPFVSGPY